MQTYTLGAVGREQRVGVVNSHGASVILASWLTSPPLALTATSHRDAVMPSANDLDIGASEQSWRHTQVWTFGPRNFELNKLSSVSPLHFSNRKRDIYLFHLYKKPMQWVLLLPFLYKWQDGFNKVKILPSHRAKSPEATTHVWVCCFPVCLTWTAAV